MIKYIIAIDLGGTNLKIGLFNFKLNIKEKKTLDTKRFIKKERLIQTIIDSVREIIKDNNLSKKNILGVGLGIPGPIDYKRGIIHFLPNIPGWKEVPLKKILKKRLGMNIYIDNDTNLMALAEQKLGAASKYKNVVGLTLGTGVGGGIVIEGELYHGGAFAAGEIGHIPINEKGPLCNCGGRACLESYIGNKQLLAKARNKFRRKVSLEELSRLTRQKNGKATVIWKEAGEKLGLALVGIVNLLNPDCIVIGGGISNAGGILFESIRKTIKERAMSVQAKSVKILKSKLGADAGLIGACIMVKAEGAR